MDRSNEGLDPAPGRRLGRGLISVHVATNSSLERFAASKFGGNGMDGAKHSVDIK
jgi:hypothetical protein